MWLCHRSKNDDQYYPVIAEYSLDGIFLDDIKAQHQVDIALIYAHFDEGQLIKQMISSTQLLKRNAALKSHLLAMIPTNNILPHKVTRSWAGEGYHYPGYDTVVQKLSINPSVYLAVMVPIKSTTTLNMRMIAIMILGLAGVMMAVSYLYFMMIGRMTASIETLAKFMTKVSKGDLNQKVVVAQHDEVGHLSRMFNDMVSNLNRLYRLLMDEKNRQSAIIAHLPEGIIVSDLHFRMVAANHRAEQIFNFQFSHHVGEPVVEILNNERVVSIMRKQFHSTRDTITRDINMGQSAKGKLCIFAMTSSIAKKQNGEPIGVVAVFRDVTHERELEGLRDGFLRTVSHELRTPLTSVTGFIGLLLDESAGKINVQQKEYLSICRNSASNLEKLIDDLLDLSRIEAGKVNMTYSSTTANELLSSVINSLAPLAYNKKLTLEKKLTDATLIFECDVEKIRRVLVNLVSNAIKFTAKGSIMVAAHEEADRVRFSVADTGVGLLEDERDIVFEKFRQTDYSSTRQHEGIGLGLSIVKELVELHHGSVWVESEYGRGTTFLFSLPKKAKP